MRIEVPAVLHCTAQTMLFEAMDGWRNHHRQDVRRAYRLLRHVLVKRLGHWKADHITVTFGLSSDYLNERNSEVVRRLDFLTSRPFREVAKELVARNNWQMVRIAEPRRVERIAIVLRNRSELLNSNADRPLSRTKAFKILSEEGGLGEDNVKRIAYQQPRVATSKRSRKGGTSGRLNVHKKSGDIFTG